MNRCAYIFLDEAGNFDFSQNGTRYFVLTSVSTRRPFAAHDPKVFSGNSLMDFRRPATILPRRERITKEDSC